MHNVIANFSFVFVYYNAGFLTTVTHETLSFGM